MQVHAVPDSERAFNSTGRKLPWGYDFADPDQNQRRLPEEKGPFGKSRTRRGTTRSKTPTVRSAEDIAKLENQRTVDEIFGRFKADEDKKKSSSMRGPSGTGPSLLQSTASAPNLLDGAGAASLSTSFQGGTSANNAAKEPKEVILYGFGSEVQWAALDFFEKVSGGIIYEEYDREPQNQKFSLSFGSQRSMHYRSLNKSWLRKVNEYVGGDHWIKVTFDSAQAAERACHYSPHATQGYTVFAEPYRGTGPIGGDRALRASVGGTPSQTASPSGVSSHTIAAATTSSTTLSSATATASVPPSRAPPRSLSDSLAPNTGAFPTDIDAPAQQTQPQQQQQQQPHSPTATTSSSQPRSAPLTSTTTTNTQRLRLKGARPIQFLPQEKAFLPAPPRWQQTFGALPVIGWIIGSGHGIIGDQVPRNEDGGFDSEKASLYWRFWYSVDRCFGSDFCGVREGEVDDY